MAQSIPKTMRFIAVSQILDSITERNDDQYAMFNFNAFTIRKGVRNSAFIKEYFHPSTGWVTISETIWDGVLPT